MSIHEDEVKTDGFPSRLSLAMRKADRTQAALAGELGVAASAVSAWRSGDRNPSRENIASLSRVLGVPEAWLQYGAGESPFARDTAAERAAYAKELQWHWQRQQPEGRTLGNPAGYAFEVDIETLTRETAQNSSDELLPGEVTVDLRYSVIELAGSDLGQFLDRVQFDELRDHLEAASSTGQKSAAAILAGLEHLDATSRLILLQVADFNTNGLTGPEYDSGRFMAVLRNTLDSQKGESAGGSYGLGKATMWVASRLGLVLANSDLSEPLDGQAANRFLGRVEMPWHSLDGGDWAGPGWYGTPDPERQVARSYFDNATLADDLYLARPDDRPGTTFLIVGAYDPSDAAEEIDELARDIRRAVAVNFWPAMIGSDGSEPRLTVRVRTQRGSQIITDALVEPREYVEPLVDALAKHRGGEVVTALEEIGDVVVESAPLGIPARGAEPAHESTEQETVVLVARAADDAPEELVNRIFYFRGNQMVIHQARPPMPFGAIPFYGIAMAGSAAGDDAVALHAERFLRTSEPPAHDNWTATPELTAAYARGARTRIVTDYPAEVVKAIKRQIVQPTPRTEDGPEALKELLRVVVPTGGESPLRPRVRSITGGPNDDGAWDVRVAVTLPARKAAWEFTPILKFATDSGAALSVKWALLGEVARCEVVDGKRIRTAARARTVEFHGVSDPATHPVAASRSTVYVDFRSVHAEGSE